MLASATSLSRPSRLPDSAARASFFPARLTLRSATAQTSTITTLNNSPALNNLASLLLITRRCEPTCHHEPSTWWFSCRRSQKHFFTLAEVAQSTRTWCGQQPPIRVARRFFLTRCIPTNFAVPRRTGSCRRCHRICTTNDQTGCQDTKAATAYRETPRLFIRHALPCPQLISVLPFLGSTHDRHCSIRCTWPDHGVSASTSPSMSCQPHLP